MPTRIRDYRAIYTWRPISDPRLDDATARGIERRLALILRRWEGTPYMQGQRRCGVATDCRGFAFGVFDELFGFERPEAWIIFPQDGALHNRRAAEEIAERIRVIYEADRVVDRSMEPGDAVLMAGAGGAGPGHFLIVGPEPNAIWHAGNVRVTRTGMGFDRFHQRIVAVFRVRERSAWAT